MNTERSAGILLHPTSLPGDYGVGSLGQSARWFVDWLVERGQRVWQILPLGPTGANNSPYQCFSAFAGNPLLIDLAMLVDWGYLSADDLAHCPSFSTQAVDFDGVEAYREPLLQKAFNTFRESGGFGDEAYVHFWNEHNWWLESWSLFDACRKNMSGKDWSAWERALIDREEGALHFYYRTYRDDVEYQCFLQFMFLRQWFLLKDYANERGIQILGDIPLYVSYDSVDVWANQDIFMLDQRKRPTHVGGVPPDYFSETGQLWGNPLFDWEKLKARNYSWWTARVHFNLHLFDSVRIDHFRGLESFWAIPRGEKTAIKGEWMKADGDALFALLREQRGELAIVAEDLGTITDEVHALRKKYQLPGMKVLQFAFGAKPSNEHLPHNHAEDFIAYTGTHDNDTTVGWWRSLKGAERQHVLHYVAGNREEKHWRMNRLALASVARLAIIPMQDVMGLGTQSRMNIPGTVDGNWGWRFTRKQVRKSDGEKLLELTRLYGRL